MPSDINIAKRRVDGLEPLLPTGSCIQCCCLSRVEHLQAVQSIPVGKKDFEESKIRTIIFFLTWLGWVFLDR